MLPQRPLQHIVQCYPNSQQRPLCTALHIQQSSVWACAQVPVEAVIVSVDREGRRHCGSGCGGSQWVEATYAYTYANATRTSNVLNIFGVREDAGKFDWFEKRQQDQKPVEAYVDPGNPERATLSREFDADSAFRRALGWFVICALLLGYHCCFATVLCAGRCGHA